METIGNHKKKKHWKNCGFHGIIVNAFYELNLVDLNRWVFSPLKIFLDIPEVLPVFYSRLLLFTIEIQ